MHLRFNIERGKCVMAIRAQNRISRLRHSNRYPVISKEFRIRLLTRPPVCLCAVSGLACVLNRKVYHTVFSPSSRRSLKLPALLYHLLQYVSRTGNWSERVDQCYNRGNTMPVRVETLRGHVVRKESSR